MVEYFLVGKINSADENDDGFVRITSYSDFSKRFNALAEVYLDFWGDKKSFIIEKSKYRQKNLCIKFKHFDSSRDSQLLVGREMFIKKDDVAELPINNFFIHDLIGSKVLIKDMQIGLITDVMKTPANDVIVIIGEDKREVLVPFVLEFIDNFDPEKKILLLKHNVDLSDDQD